MTGKEWMATHLKTCKKQKGAVIKMPNGSTLGLYAGFDTSVDETIVICKVCGARREGLEP